MEQERALIVMANINHIGFSFVIVYAHNYGTDCVRLFQKIKHVVKQYSSDSIHVVGKTGAVLFIMGRSASPQSKDKA